MASSTWANGKRSRECWEGGRASSKGARLLPRPHAGVLGMLEKQSQRGAWQAAEGGKETGARAMAEAPRELGMVQVSPGLLG